MFYFADELKFIFYTAARNLFVSARGGLRRFFQRLRGPKFVRIYPKSNFLTPLNVRVFLFCCGKPTS